MQIDRVNFESFIRTLDSRSFVTLHRKAPFKVNVIPSGLLYTPLSTGKPRIQEWQYIDRVVSRFAEQGSFHPGDYHDITMNASYLLTLIYDYVRLSKD